MLITDTNALRQALNKLKKADLIAKILDIANQDDIIGHSLIKQYLPPKQTTQPPFDLTRFTEHLGNDHYFDDDDYYATDLYFDEQTDFDDDLDEIDHYVTSLIGRLSTDPLVFLPEVLLLSMTRTRLDEMYEPSATTDGITDLIETEVQLLQTLDASTQRQIRDIILTHFNRFTTKYPWPTPIRALGGFLTFFGPDDSPTLEAAAKQYARTLDDPDPYPFVTSILNDLHVDLLLAQGNVETAKQFTELHFADTDMQHRRLLLIKAESDFDALERLADQSSIFEWQEALIDHYRQIQDYPKLAGVLENKFFEQDTFDAFQTLRGVLKQASQWDAQREHLLTRMMTTVSPTTVAEIFTDEHEYDRLFTLLSKYPDAFELLIANGATAYPSHPAQVTALFLNCLNSRVKSANKRSAYYHLGRILTAFAKTGNVKLADQWRTKVIAQYPRRTAMHDELLKLNF